MLANHQHLTPNTQHPTSAVTFCEFCMPEAFCEIEIVRKGSVKSVSSVREKTPQQVTCVSSHRVGAFYFSQNNTEEQNTQYSTETLSQPISQSVTTNRSLTQHDPKKEKELTTNTSKPLPSYQHSISFSISGIVSRLKTGLFTPARFCCR